MSGTTSFGGLSRAHPGLRSAITAYYTAATVLHGAATMTPTASNLYYQPFYLPKMTIDRIAIEITTGAAGLARLGLYNNANGGPTSLILDAGTVDTTNIAVVEATISALTLPDDWVWAAVVFNATPVVRAGSADNSWILGATNTTQGRSSLSTGFAFAALPNPATAPASYIVGPAVFLRKS